MIVVAETRKKAGPAKGSVEESRTVEYLAAGVGVDPYAGNTPTLDPELEKIRDAEIEKNGGPVLVTHGEPTIDPELVKARDAEIKRDAERAGKSSPAPAAAKKSAASKSEKS